MGRKCRSFFPGGKKGIELSINFLVIVIISIVMLSTGILIVEKYFSTAEEIKTALDEQTVSQIEDLMDEGDTVAIPLKRKTVEVGESALFGLGILNIDEDTADFEVDVSLSSAYGHDKSPIDPAELSSHPEEWIMYSRYYTLDYKEDVKTPIRIEIPGGSIPGTYIYNVEVLTEGSRYGLTKIYVEVP